MDWNSKNDRREFQQVNCSIAQLGPIWQPVLIIALTLPVTPRNCSIYSLIPITHIQQPILLQGFLPPGSYNISGKCHGVKVLPNINPIRSAVMFLLINQDHMTIKSLLISCASDSWVGVPLPNTQGFILSVPLRYEHEKRDALPALLKCQRQIPSKTKKPINHKTNPPCSRSPRNLGTAGLG